MSFATVVQVASVFVVAVLQFVQGKLSKPNSCEDEYAVCH